MLSLRNTTMKARITMPELTGVNGSGATQITIDGFEFELRDLTVDVSGASTLRGQIDAGNLRADVSGASRLELTGQGQDGRITVSGASQANLADFRHAERGRGGQRRQPGRGQRQRPVGR